jgi:hypothetical protein
MGLSTMEISEQMGLKNLKEREWFDEHGRRFLCPPSGEKIIPTKFKTHARLKEFIFMRDGFRCRICGVSPAFIPKNYNAMENVLIFKSDAVICFELDHIKSRFNGGNNHPSNLQTLCNRCNSKKGCN